MKNTPQSQSPALRKNLDRLFQAVCILSAASAVGVLLVLILSITLKGWKHLGWGFISSIASPDAEKSGVLPPLVGSVLVCLICMLAAIPVGVGTAVLLEEFKPKDKWLGRLHGLAGVNITNLAGVPSIVYGILGVTVFATAFGVFEGSETAPPAIGVQWFDQYTLPDNSAVFVKADGPAPQTPEAQARAVIKETARFCAAAKAAPDQAKEALPLYRGALETLATLPETQKALAGATLPAGTRDLCAALSAPAILPADGDLASAGAALAPRIQAIASVRLALRNRALPLEAQAASAASEKERDALDSESAHLRRLLSALQDDTKNALSLALGAHPLRQTLAPAGGNRLLGGDIGYQTGRPVALAFKSGVQEEAKAEQEARLDALAGAIKDALDEAREGERHTGKVRMTAAGADQLATLLLAAQKIGTPGVQKMLAGKLAGLDGAEGSALRKGRADLLESLRQTLASPAAGHPNELAIGAPSMRVNRTLWYHLALPFGRGVLAGGLTLMLVVLPVVIVASQEALRAVPQTLRQAALGLGATPLQTVTQTVLPAATPGICTGVILALSRAIGEAAPILILGGVVYITFLPGHLMDSFTVMPLQIFSWASEPKAEFHELAAAGILILILVLAAFNGIAVLIRHKTTQ